MYSFRCLLLLQFIFVCRLDWYLRETITSKLEGVGFSEMKQCLEFKFRLRYLGDLLTIFLSENWINIIFLLLSLLGTYRRDLSALYRQILMVSEITC